MEDLRDFVLVDPVVCVQEDTEDNMFDLHRKERKEREKEKGFHYSTIAINFTFNSGPSGLADHKIAAKWTQLGTIDEPMIPVYPRETQSANMSRSS